MLKSKMPIYCSGLALALMTGAFSAMPVQAQAVEEYAYATQADDDDFTASDANVIDDDDGDDSAAAVDDEDDGVDTIASGDGEQRCAAQFRSFDPSSGTYMTYDGDRVPCPYL